MRILPTAAFILGIAALLAIVEHAGAASVFGAMASVGWGAVLLLLARVGLEVLMGTAWFVLAPGDTRPHPTLGPFVWARMIRDAASECLPLSALGGFVLGARALAISNRRGRGVSGAFAAASTAVDVTLELVAQLLYLAGGLAMLHAIRPHLPLVRSLLVGMLLLGAGAAIFLVLQSRGTALLGRFAARTLRRWSNLAGGVTAGLEAVSAVHAATWRLVAAMLLHLLAWIGNGLEAWLILFLMGHAVSLRAALIIDSLLYGLRSFAFMVPNALGVQEAGYVVLGGLFGLDMGTCLALSLLRRARDLVLGIPALAIWQVLEGRRLRRRRAAGFVAGLDTAP